MQTDTLFHNGFRGFAKFTARKKLGVNREEFAS